jgi:hypothetical protein
MPSASDVVFSDHHAARIRDGRTREIATPNRPTNATQAAFCLLVRRWPETCGIRRSRRQITFLFSVNKRLVIV